MRTSCAACRKKTATRKDSDGYELQKLLHFWVAMENRIWHFSIWHFRGHLRTTDNMNQKRLGKLHSLLPSRIFPSSPRLHRREWLTTARWREHQTLCATDIEVRDQNAPGSRSVTCRSKRVPKVRSCWNLCWDPLIQNISLKDFFRNCCREDVFTVFL